MVSLTLVAAILYLVGVAEYGFGVRTKSSRRSRIASVLLALVGLLAVYFGF
mgnify:FL=1